LNPKEEEITKEEREKQLKIEDVDDFAVFPGARAGS
jgi:hypothetical protein